MTFRTRILLAALVAAIAPLTIFALGARQQVRAELRAQSERRTAASKARAKSSAEVGLSWEARARVRMPSRTGHQGESSAISASASRVALAPKLEAMAPGWTSISSMPKGASSSRRASDRACTAALEAQ